MEEPRLSLSLFLFKTTVEETPAAGPNAEGRVLPQIPLPKWPNTLSLLLGTLLSYCWLD